jgi:hypothetical protein
LTTSFNKRVGSFISQAILRGRGMEVVVVEDEKREEEEDKRTNKRNILI